MLLFYSRTCKNTSRTNEEVEPTLKKFQETMSKYKFMELNTAQRRRGLEEKIPDIRKTLQMVTFLKEKKDDPESIETTFELNDTLFAKAKLDPVDTVHLWLGVSSVTTPFALRSHCGMLINVDPWQSLSRGGDDRRM